MSTEMSIIAQKKTECGWYTFAVKPFSYQHYVVFAFFADVRNHFGIPPVCKRRGTPEDHGLCEDELHDLGDHSFTFVTMNEIEKYDFDQKVPDGTTVKDILGPEFFANLRESKILGIDRFLIGFFS